MTTLTTLIPAYRADFLGPLLRGLQAQTWRDFRVLIADDSPGRTIGAALRAGRFDADRAGLRLTVVPGGGGVLSNHRRALEAWDGATPLVHLLMDDDVVDPTFYERHVALHAAAPEIAASVSQRRLIDAHGAPMGLLPLPDFVQASPDDAILVDGDTLVRSTVARCENWLGELSNMVLSARAAQRFPAPPREGVSWFGLPDIGLLLNAQDLGPIAFWRETLGSFRQHAGQTTVDTASRPLKIAHLAWVSFALMARRSGQLDDEATRQAVAVAIRRCLTPYAADADVRPFLLLAAEGLDDLDAFTQRFAEQWQVLLEANADTRRGAKPARTLAVVNTAAPLAPAAQATVTEHAEPGLLILDDFFPNLLTGFRVAEYNALMQRCERLRILSCAEDFEARHAEYAALYPQFAARVQRFDASQPPRSGEVVYCNFLFNAHRFLPWIERHRLPFAFTLYPGGGFGIGWPASERNLRQVLASPWLRHIVTTQPVTEAYLQDFAQRHGLGLPACTSVPGSTAHAMYFDAEASRHGAYFGAGKDTLDIVYVAEQYMPGAENKGYPEFAAAMVALADLPFLRVHVVGPLKPEHTQVDFAPLGERIRFHGRMDTATLQRQFRQMDVSVSLSRPGVLHPGNFDGFPTCSTVEASLCGAALIANDPLAQNSWYTQGESMLLVEPEPGSIETAVRWLAEDPRRIPALAAQGRAVAHEHYAPEVQIGPRWAMMQALMSAGRQQIARAA